MENVRPFPHQADRDALTRNVPYDADAENLIVSAIMHDAPAYQECAQIITRNDLYLRHTRLIWDVVGGMIAEQKQQNPGLADKDVRLHPVLVKAEIQKLDRLGEVNGGLLIDKLGSDYISPLMTPSFAEQVRERARLRRHLEHATAIEAAVLSGTADPDHLDKLVAAQHENAQPTAGPAASSHLTGALLDWAPFFATDFGATVLLPGKLLAPGQQIAVVGEGKAGKSLLIQELMWRIATGQSCLGDRPQDPIPVLYIDAENGHQDIWDRFISYGGGPDRMGLLSYASFPPVRPLDTAGGGQDLLALVRECEAQIVCLDTVSRFISGPENDADTWLSLYRHTLLPLKRQGIASVRLDHLGKDSDRGARGSSAKNQDVDHVWELRAQGGGALSLKRAYTRTGIGPDQFSLVRQARKDGDRYLPGQTRHILMTWDTEEEHAEGTVEWLVDQLDALGLPNDAGNPRTKAALAAARIPAAKNKIEAAVRHRKNRDNSGSPDGFPQPLPEGVPGERSPGTSKGSQKPQVNHSPGTSREPTGMAGSPPSPPPKEGKGEEAPGSEDPQTPDCTICNRPMNTDWAHRGYTTHLGCDPTTGSHPAA
ncbi:AAA family ATPase [Streptomyces sp. NPDC051577]|uniref:AAA family ATPase n=1 Tax=Streptomyces sp. NPDC051577 TaxID=3155166 RepID=UPI003419BE0F